MSATKPATPSSYFLIHAETGQRYPIRGNVIIGRASGDICFPRDTKLSQQHCEVSPSELGLAVRDLHSANGTYIDGKQMPAARNFLLQEGGQLQIGDQEFTLLTVTLTKNIRKRRKKKRRKSGESYGQVILIVVAAFLVFAYNKRAFDRGSAAMALSQKQLGDIFETYQEIETSLQRETAPPHEIARRMQGQVLGRLSALSRRWAEFQPAESDRQLFNAQLRFAGALAGHAKADIMYITTGDTKYVDDMDTYTDQIESLINEMHGLSGGDKFPALMQSPLQLVEREMHQCLRDYKKLGVAVQNKEMTQKQMSQLIRQDLLPKLNAAYSRMGAIAPQNNFENKKVVLEQKLLTAMIGQVKSMAVVADGGDQKYVDELQHYTDEVRKVDRQLRDALGLGRTPANTEGPHNP